MDDSVVTPLVTALQTDSSAEVRREAAIALGRVDAPTTQTLDALQEAVGDDNVQVRRAALIGLARKGNHDAAERLLTLMEESPEIAYDIARAIVAMGDTSLVPAIVEKLGSASSARARGGAARALGGLASGDRRGDDPLFVWEDDEHQRHVLC